MITALTWSERLPGTAAPSNAPHHDLLVLRPAARVVGLQLDWPLFEIVQAVILQHSCAIDTDQAGRVLHPKLQEPPIAGLDRRIEPAFYGVQRAGGVVRAFHVMKLDLIMSATRALPRRAEHDAAIVMS